MNEALHAWHPDHLGARRGCAHQADGHAHAPVRTHHGQGLRLSAHSIAQAIVIAVLPALFGASFHTNALKLLAVAAVVVLETGVLLMPVHEHRGRGAVPVPAHRAAHQHLAQRRRADRLYGCRDHSGIDTMP